MDRSLKSANSLVRHRNVLNRAERLEVLKDQEKWDDTKSVFGLVKVAHRKVIVAKAAKEETTAAEGAVAGAEGAPPAAAGAAPAAGAAKAGAPAAAPAAGKAPAAKAKK